jgi:hypothetical protein
MSVFLIRSTISQLGSYAIVLMRLGGSSFKPDPILKLWKLSIKMLDNNNNNIYIFTVILWYKNPMRDRTVN